MDTSNSYIKMCEQALEVQKESLDTGDFYYNYSDAPRAWIQPTMMRGDYTFLPRQDQIQDLYREAQEHAMNKHPVMLINQLAWFIRDEHDMIDPNWRNTCFGMIKRKFKTMEQIWLGIYMRQVHQKLWDAEKLDWILNKELVQAKEQAKAFAEGNGYVVISDQKLPCSIGTDENSFKDKWYGNK